MQTPPRRSLGEGGFVDDIDDFLAGEHEDLSVTESLALAQNGPALNGDLADASRTPG